MMKLLRFKTVELPRRTWSPNVELGPLIGRGKFDARVRRSMIGARPEGPIVRAARVSYHAAGRHPSTEGAFPAPKFLRALGWAEENQLIRVEGIGEVNLRFQQPFAVLREHRRHPDRLVDPEPDKPAVQQVIVELLHRLRLGADRVERLQQQRPQQPLGWNRWPPAVGIDFGKLAIERGQHIIDDATDHAQRMRRRNTVLKINIQEDRPSSPAWRLQQLLDYRDGMQGRFLTLRDRFFLLSATAPLDLCSEYLRIACTAKKGRVRI